MTTDTPKPARDDLEKRIVLPQQEIDDLEWTWGIGDIDRALQNLELERRRLEAALQSQAAERTDEHFLEAQDYPKSAFVVPLEFARQLERELTAAKDDLIVALFERNAAEARALKAEALLREWLEAECDSEDEEYQPWVDSFTARIRALPIEGEKQEDFSASAKPLELTRKAVEP